MKVTFISFQENSDILGVKYLHAYITAKGYDSSILLIPDAGVANVRAATDYISKRKPDVLCFSAMSYEFKRAQNVMNTLRNRFQRRPTIFGGIHATADPESCLAFSDIAVRGEGEETLLELLQTLEEKGLDNLSQVDGIVFKQGSQLIHTKIRQPIQALDTLPYPGHLPAEMYVTHQGNIRSVKMPDIYKRYARYQGSFLSILSSRGCPFSCNYCCNSVLKSLYGKNSIRKRNLQCVLDEIVQETRRFKDILYVNFQDDCFMMHSLESIADFSRRYSKEMAIPFCIRTTPKHIDREKLSLLKGAGLRWVFIGLQTGSDRVNREVYARGVSCKKFLEVANIVSELKLSPWYDIILDNPYETEADHLSTIDVLLRTPRPFQLDLFSLDYFPGTELRRRAIADKIPIPELGTKSYTKPESKMINRYIRMSATLPAGIMRLLLGIRKTRIGRIIGTSFYGLSLLLEPFIYLWLIYKSNDFRIFRTARVVKTFCPNAINKLFLRREG